MHHLTESDVGQTLAAFLRSRMEGTAWSRIQKLVRSRHVLVHGNICTDAARRLKAGEVVKVLEVAAAPLPKADDVAVVHVDDDVVVVEKPTGVNTTRHHEEASWPTRRRQVQPTLEELVPDAIGRHLFRRLGGVAGRGEPKRRRIQPVRAVHRIDRETSGLVVFTRNVPASRILVGGGTKVAEINPSSHAVATTATVTGGVLSMQPYEDQVAIAVGDTVDYYVRAAAGTYAQNSISKKG